jgi:phosphoribosylformimino-5-aminoimidazole carboxamide ribotide isomerase
MHLYPAIDLKAGEVVRLRQGRMDDATGFGRSPCQWAGHWSSLGFDRLHVVDLDGAFAGQSQNGEAVRAIRAAFSGFVQLGGGIRSEAHIARWLDAGVDRLILGTAALRDPALVLRAAKAHAGKIAIGIDVRDGCVAVEGWAEQTTVKATDLVQQFANAGVAAVIVTDIHRDGLNQGVNAALCAELAAASCLPVIASGGVSHLDDLSALKAITSPPIEGAIIGRAFYDATLDPQSALSLVSQVF